MLCQVPPRRRRDAGFSLVELLMSLAIIAVVAVIAIPISGNSLRYFKISGDARELSNSAAVAKMRAASRFTRARLRANTSDKTFYVELGTIDNSVSPAKWNWATDGKVSLLSSNVSYAFGSVATAPGTATAPALPAACLDHDEHAIGNTNCIVFNSRGLPIDPANGNPLASTFYVGDGTSVYCISVSATGFVTVWQTPQISTPTWSQQ